jgi:hypothetical protein
MTSAHADDSASFGTTIFNRFGYYKGFYTVTGKLSPWGVYIYTRVGGQLVMQNAGWSELVKKQPYANLSPYSASLRQQYNCHVTFGYAFNLAGIHWDLEAARPSKSNWLTDSPWNHRCNW